MFSNIIGNFLGNIKALRFYVDNVDITIESSLSNITNEESISFYKMIAILIKECVEFKKIGQNNFVEKLLEEFPQEMDCEMYKKLFLNIEEMANILYLEKMNAYSYTKMHRSIKEEYEKLDSLNSQKDILYNGSLMLLITYYENLLASLFKFDFIAHPERINLDLKTVTYNILRKYNDIENVKEHLVENEVTGMMYKSHDDWMKYFSEKIKLSLSLINKNSKDIREIIARRNILVHNNGKVNSTYLSITNLSNKDVGSVLEVDKEYLNYAIDTIELAALSITIEFWLKECSKDEEEINKIEAILFSECIEANKWKIGKHLYGICCENKHLKDADLLLLKINMWQCYKWLGEMDEVKENILNLDISAKQPKYKLAILALLDKEEDFWEEYDNQNDINEHNIKEWPLFMNIREGDLYQKRFLDKKEEISPMKEGEDGCTEKYIDVECVES